MALVVTDDWIAGHIPTRCRRIGAVFSFTAFVANSADAH